MTRLLLILLLQRACCLALRTNWPPLPSEYYMAIALPKTKLVCACALPSPHAFWLRAVTPLLQELEFNQGSVYSEEERDAILRVFSANAPSCGPEFLAFEKEFSEFVGDRKSVV